MYKVRIKRVPQAKQGRSVKTGQQTSTGALSIQPTALGGSDIDQYMGEKETTVKTRLEPQPREESNVEVERDEIVMGDLNGDGMTETYVAGGKRHSEGGTPLNLPDDTFIFSDTRSMRIKDPNILAKFGKSKGSYTPAELAKQYDINKYRKILQDPNSDAVDKKTAEMMIRNYNMKLGALALAQESKKGFPQGIPMVARPYMDAAGITDEDILPTYQPKYANQEEEEAEYEEMPMNGTAPEQPSMEENTVPGYEGPNPEDIAMTEEMMQNAPMAQYGMMMGDYSMPFAQYGRVMTLPNNYQKGGTAKAPYSEKEAYTPEGVKRLNAYRKMYGLDEIDPKSSKDNIKVAAGELQQKITESNPDLVVDYMTRVSHKPNNELISVMNQKDPEGKYPRTTEGVKKAYADGKLSADDVRGAYKDKQWWYRALETDKVKLTKEEYEKKMKEEGAVKQGDKLFFQDDPNNPQLYTEYYTDEPVKDKKEDKLTTQCKCIEKETGKEYDPGKDANGNCNPCKDTDRPDLENVEEEEPPRIVPAEWTTPDLMNYYGAMKDKFSLRKYYPWATPVDLEEARPTYLDPTRDLAAQSEQANIMTNALAQFTGPQGLSSQASGIQGKAASQAADTLSRYNNANVQLANQFAAQNAQIRNQERAANQAIAKDLYDKTTLTNATFDRDRRLADNVVRQAFATGWKNASDIAMLNATSPQYEIDPRSGTVYFEGGKDIEPTNARTFDYYVQYYTRQGFEPREAIQAAKAAMGQGSNYSGPDVEALMQNASKGLIVTGPMLYPFIL